MIAPFPYFLTSSVACPSDMYANEHSDDSIPSLVQKTCGEDRSTLRQYNTLVGLWNYAHFSHVYLPTMCHRGHF